MYSLIYLSLFSIFIIFLSPTHLYAQQTKSDNESPKKNRWRFAPVPLLNYNSDTGVGYGAFVSVFKKRFIDTSRDQEIKGARYDFALNLQYYDTTQDYTYHKLILDMPRLNRWGLRVQLMGGYESWSQAWYSGLDNTMPLVADKVNTRYYQHYINNIWALPSIMQPIPAIHQAFSIFVTACIRSAELDVYPNSLLAEQEVLGKEGGNMIQLGVGIMWDERDKDPDTRDGFWSEISTRYSSLAWASDYEMWGINATHRQWIPLDQRKRAVWAYRIGMDYQGGNIPFFQKNIMGGSQWVELGGNSAMRGYKRGRLRGDLNIYTSQELRWRLGEFHVKKREVAYQLTPILDIGYSELTNQAQKKDQFLDHLHTSFGLGTRFIYDESFVIRLDFAFVIEQMQKENSSDTYTQLMPSFFAIVNHTF